MLDGPCYLCGQPDRECRESGCGVVPTVSECPTVEDFNQIMDDLLNEKSKLLASVKRLDNIVLAMSRFKKQHLDVGK